MLKLLNKHWDVIEEGCDCSDYRDSPTIIVGLVLQDAITYDIRKDKITNVVTQEFGSIRYIRCMWCDALLKKWRVSV